MADMQQQQGCNASECVCSLLSTIYGTGNLPVHQRLLTVWGLLTKQTGDSNPAGAATYQIALVDEQQHVFVSGILLDMLLQVPAACAQRVSSIQDLQHQKGSYSAAAPTPPF